MESRKEYELDKSLVCEKFTNPPVNFFLNLIKCWILNKYEEIELNQALSPS